MHDRLPALIFGGCLFIWGWQMLLAQRELPISAGTDAEAVYLRRRIRRRQQVAGMILLIAIMIPLGDSLIPWKKAPATFAIYWMIVIGLALWTGILGVGDMVATRAFMSLELTRLQRKQMELENAAQQLRRGEGNGSPGH